VAPGSLASEGRRLHVDLDFRLTFQRFQFLQKPGELALQVRLIAAELADEVPAQKSLDHAPQPDLPRSLRGLGPVEARADTVEYKGLLLRDVSERSDERFLEQGDAPRAPDRIDDLIGQFAFEDAPGLKFCESLCAQPEKVGGILARKKDVSRRKSMRDGVLAACLFALRCPGAGARLRVLAVGFYIVFG